LPALSLADRIEQTENALTAPDLAVLLSLATATVFKMARAGRIPSFRIGSAVRFDPRTVAQWLRSR
jgi:excisionase family DNA binding protein